MYKRDPPSNNHTNNPTFSSSLLNEIFLSIDREPPAVAADSSNLRRLLDQDRKMSSLRRSRLVHKWMDKPSFGDLIVPTPPPPPPPVVPAVVDEDPDSFFSTTSVSSSDSSFGGLSSTASEAETPSFDSSSKPKTSCFGPFRAPKPVKTKAKVANTDLFGEDCSTNRSSSSSSSRALKIYSQLKSLKQPISPGIKLAKYINSLFIKEASTSTSRKKKTTKNTKPDNPIFRGVPAPERRYKSEETSPEWPISFTSSFTKRDIPSSTSAISTSIASDHKAALMKRYDELRRLKIGDIEEEEEEEEVDMNRKVLEEVALDLLNNYWNRKKTENDNDDDNNDKDDSSCSSSDLFEIDHLSLIGNEELPVYETTRILS
ncbi:hypothetical protein V2J09_010070 [Rumex salicifolius]